MLGSYLPSQHQNVFGLLARTLRGGPAARAAVGHTALGLLTIPLDAALRRYDARREAVAAPPHDPIIIVCGAPRSGTTLVTQVFLRHLHSTYFSNLTNLFPRSPITATQLFGLAAANRDVETESYYGKTRRMRGPNDALYLWDRWVGANRQEVPHELPAEAGAAMRGFFGAWQQAFPGPLITKNNRLVMFANLVADAVPSTSFVCLRRDPVSLALSLLDARRSILGDLTRPYGAVDADYFEAAAGQTPELQVCLQVQHYERAISRQQQLLGQDRFRVLEYARFCADPLVAIREVASRHPATGPVRDPEGVVPFRYSRGRGDRPDVRTVIEGHCRELGLLAAEAAA